MVYNLGNRNKHSWTIEVCVLITQRKAFWKHADLLRFFFVPFCLWQWHLWGPRCPADFLNLSRKDTWWIELNNPHLVFHWCHQCKVPWASGDLRILAQASTPGVYPLAPPVPVPTEHPAQPSTRGALACAGERKQCWGSRTRWGCSRMPGGCTLGPVGTPPRGTRCCPRGSPWSRPRWWLSGSRKLQREHRPHCVVRSWPPVGAAISQALGTPVLQALFCLGLYHPAALFVPGDLPHKRCLLASLNPLKVLLDPTTGTLLWGHFLGLVWQFFLQKQVTTGPVSILSRPFLRGKAVACFPNSPLTRCGAVLQLCDVILMAKCMREFVCSCALTFSGLFSTMVDAKDKACDG